jgi:hypothetical protein
MSREVSVRTKVPASDTPEFKLWFPVSMELIRVLLLYRGLGFGGPPKFGSLYGLLVPCQYPVKFSGM